MESSALVVVDMQNGFCKPDGLIYVPQAQEQIPSVSEAIAAARAAGALVIYTRVTWRSADDVVAGLGDNIPPLKERWSSPGGFSPTAWGRAIVEELAPRPDDTILDKRAFYPVGLEDFLLQRGVDTAYVAGTTANNCVYAACLACFEAGVRVRAIRECISSFDESSREPWLTNVDRYLGSVVGVEALAATVATSRPARSLVEPAVRCRALPASDPAG